MQTTPSGYREMISRQAGILLLGIAALVAISEGAWAAEQATGEKQRPHQPQKLSAVEKPKAMLLVGDDLSAWRSPTGDWQIVGKAEMAPQAPEKLTAEPGAGVLYNGPQGRTSNLLSKAEFGDVKAHIEFMVPEGSNSGVYFQGRYEIQILDSWGVDQPGYGDCGGIYQRWEDGRGFEGHPPRKNASRRPGQWQAFDVIFRAPRFDAEGNKTENARFVKVLHNGVLIHEDVEVTGPTRAAAFGDEKPKGPLMLQGDHGPVAYRKIRIVPVELP